MTLPRSHSMLLSIVVADPRGGARALNALRTLREGRLALPYEVIVAIGGDDPSKRTAFQQEFPLVSTVHVPGVHELGKLYQRGSELAQGRYVLLLDGSAMLTATAIESLIHFMDKSQWVSAVAPRLVSPGGVERSSAKSFPTVASALAEFQGHTNGPEVAPRLQNALTRQVTTPKEVEAVQMGCCMLKRATIQEVGGWEPGYAIGSEGLDWCRRARLKGFSVFYHPGVVGQLCDEPREDAEAIAAQLAGACRFIHCHHGVVSLGALKLLLALASLKGMLLDGGASLIPGTHRANARFAFRRAWYVMGALLNPGRSLPA